MGKQKQVKNSSKSGQMSDKSPKTKEEKDYASMLTSDNVVGKVLDPKIIEKIIAKNRARKAIENQKILVNTMMSVA